MFCGHRHHNIYPQLAPGWGQMLAERRAAGLRETQGFLTSTGRFVGREEALGLAIAAGQVVEGETHHKRDLFSEDLY